MIILTVDSKKPTISSDSMNHTYPRVRYYRPNQHLFTRPFSQNYISKRIKLKQHFSPNLQQTSEPVINKEKSSSKNFASDISIKDDLFLGTEGLSASKYHKRLILDTLKEKDYEIVPEKPANNYIRFTSKQANSKVQIPFQKQNLDFAKPFFSYKTYRVNWDNLERQSNDIKADEFKGSPIDLFGLELASNIPSKNLTRPNRQSQQQNVATTTTTTVPVTTTVSTTTSITTPPSPSITTTVSTTTLTTATTTSSPTTSQLNSCYTQICDQTITGRQLSYTRFVTF